TAGEPVQDIAYHHLADGAIPRKRLIEHTRTLFIDDSAPSLAAPLPLGELGRVGLPYETYRLALTDDLLAAVFGDKLRPDVTEALRDPRISGYLSGAALADHFPAGEAGEYWIRSGIAGYASDAVQHFYLPRQYTDAFGSVTTLDYESLAL